jgi:hypothetical protein
MVALRLTQVAESFEAAEAAALALAHDGRELEAGVLEPPEWLADLVTLDLTNNLDPSDFSIQDVLIEVRQKT